MYFTGEKLIFTFKIPPYVFTCVICIPHKHFFACIKLDHLRITA